MPLVLALLIPFGGFIILCAIWRDKLNWEVVQEYLFWCFLGVVAGNLLVTLWEILRGDL